MRKIIMDVDTGTDDALALILAGKNKDLDLVAVTVTWGNQPVESCVENTLNVLHLIHRDDVPVYQGEEHALRMDKRAQRELVNPSSPIDYTDRNGTVHSLHPARMPLEKATREKEKKSAVDFLIETLTKTKEKITLVPIGPVTNIGTAFMRCPDIIQGIEEIVFMGGSVGMGNVSPSAEANFYNDPDALKYILDSGIKCTFMGLNATHSVSFSKEISASYETLGTPEGKFAHYLIETRRDVEQTLGWHDGSEEPVHDPLAVAYLIDPTVITEMLHAKTDIDTSPSITSGTLILNGESGNENVFIAMKGDKEKYHGLIKEGLL